MPNKVPRLTANEPGTGAEEPATEAATGLGSGSFDGHGPEARQRCDDEREHDRNRLRGRGDDEPATEPRQRPAECEGQHPDGRDEARRAGTGERRHGNARLPDEEHAATENCQAGTPSELRGIVDRRRAVVVTRWVSHPSRLRRYGRE